MQFAIVILAAGKGTRLKTQRPKVLHEVGGKTMLRHVVDAARQIVPPEDIYVIVGHHAGEVKSSLVDLPLKYIEQREQRGTGHAMQQAQRALSGYENVLVLSADVPLIRPESIREIRDFHLRKRAAMTVLTAEPPNVAGYGRIIRQPHDPDAVDAIVEQKSLTADQERIPETNSGIYAFSTRPLYTHINELKPNNSQGELYLTDMAAVLRRAGETVLALRARDANEVLGANTIEEMMQIDAAFRLSTARKLMAAGVTIFQPATTIIDADVRVAADTVLEPFVQLLGHTTIGSGCRIRSYSVLENATLGNRITVRNHCIITGSHVMDGAILGPYAHIRPECEIGEGAHVGNFVETKKLRMGKDSKANHLAYLGDAEIGDGVNVGAGTITCNYDGVHKHKTVIGNGVFVGSNATLVAPINVGDGSYIAAASCITEDVPEKALALGRSRQTIKEGWTPRKKA